MTLLNEEQQRYYCFKDDQLWVGNEQASKATATNRGDSNRGASSIRLYYTVPLLIIGFVLASAGTSGALEGVVFGLGVLLWAIGALGTVYWVVNRFAGPRAAKWAVGLVVLSLVIDLIFGQREE